MRRILAVFACALAAAAFAANMASQKWVEMKIGESENRMLVNRSVLPMAVDAGTNGTIYASFEPADVAALSVTNSTNAAIANGMVFAWVGDGSYTNAALGTAIFSTKTNFVWRGTLSSVVDGVDTFGGIGGFGVVGTLVTKTQAEEITGGRR